MTYLGQGIATSSLLFLFKIKEEKENGKRGCAIRREYSAYSFFHPDAKLFSLIENVGIGKRIDNMIKPCSCFDNYRIFFFSKYRV